MRRRSRDQAPLPLGKPIPVKLNGEEREAKGHRLAVIGHAIRGYKRKLTVDSRDAKKAIKNLEKGARRHRGHAHPRRGTARMQGDLSFEEKQRSTKVLAEVERIAQGGNAPVPPHTFVPSGAGEGKCYSCTHPKGSLGFAPFPFAGAGAAGPRGPQGSGEREAYGGAHPFVATGDAGNAKTMCKTCGSGKTDPVHVDASPADKKAPTKLKGVARPEPRS